MTNVLTLWRADKRIFQPGDQIQTAGEYAGMFKGAGPEVEQALERFRPSNKTPRARCLFLYMQERPAKKHWVLMTGGKLYEVQIAAGDVLHRGDSVLMDQMRVSIENDKRDPLEELAGRYWAGEMTSQPIIEILILSGTVTQVLQSSEEARIAAFKAYKNGDW